MDKDSIIRNIIKEIVKECTSLKGIPVHENFVSYYTKLLILDPNWGISSDYMSNRNDVQKFIKFVVHRLEDQTTPDMITLKIQLYFSCNFDNREELIRKNRSNLLARMAPLKLEIMETEDVQSKDEIASLYEKIVYFITLMSGLGNPTLSTVFIEAKTALTSVLFEEEVIEFAQLEVKEKEEQLFDLCKLVTGIRLFNKDSKKGGAGMENLPKLMKSALQGLKMGLEKDLRRILDKVNMLTTALDHAFHLDQIQTGRCFVEQQFPKGVSIDDVNLIRDYLIVYRQCEIFFRRLIAECELLRHNFLETLDTFDTTMVDLHGIVQFRSAIPCDHVFPVFRELSDIWCQLQDQAMLLAKLEQIRTNLKLYIKDPKYDPAVVEAFIGEDGALTDAQRFKKYYIDEIIRQQLAVPDITIGKPKMELSNKDFQYLGFCPFKLVETDGALIPGDQNYGLIKKGQRYYVCSSVLAGESFVMNPDKYIIQILDMARNRPELVNFLNLKEDLISVLDIGTLIDREVYVEPLTKDQDIQTEDHVIPKHIDRNYYWNVWDLKREAIKLADLCNMATVQCQTEHSGNKFSIGVQTVDMKDEEHQTRKDNYTNVPKPSIYLFGLRGRKDDKQLIVDLTRPVDE